jgi:archaellum biogenesis ATPase FlaH
VPSFKRAPLPPGALSDLMDALHQLHLVAGHPSTRDLQRDIGGRGATSHAAIHKVFTGDRVPNWGRLERLVEVMARRARRDEKAEAERFRALWTQAAGSGSQATEPGTSVSAGVEGHKRLVDPEAEPHFRSLSELMPEVVDELEAVGMRSAVGSFRVPTGFDDLDALLGGWSHGYLIVIGGRPSSGKTTLLLDFCRAASVEYRLPTMVISGEISNRDLQLRLLSAQALVPSHTMITGLMSEEDWTRLVQAMPAILDAPISIGTPQDFRMEQLIDDATSLAQKSRLKLLLIDSLEWATNSESVSVEFTLQRLKNLAETLKIPVVISAQAERLQEQERVPRVSPIRSLIHGGAIERVADVIIMLHRPDQDDPEHPRAGEADLIVAKSRNGPTATVTVASQFHYCRFVDMMPGVYPLFPVEASVEVQASAHDRDLFRRLLEQIPPDGEVVDWLKNNFVLKYFPVRYLDAVAQMAKMMSLEVVGFDDKEVNDRHNDLCQAIDNFFTIRFFIILLPIKAELG